MTCEGSNPPGMDLRLGWVGALVAQGQLSGIDAQEWEEKCPEQVPAKDQVSSRT
jgi:hypothetical protein